VLHFGHGGHERNRGRRALKDQDPYVRKTAAICVVKLHDISPELVAEQGFIGSLETLLGDANPTVVSNAVAALQEIGSRTNTKLLKLTPSTVLKLLAVLNEASEWGQVFILDALAGYKPCSPAEAETMVDRVKPRLQHANSAVVLSSTKVIIQCLDRLEDEDKIAGMPTPLGLLCCSCACARALRRGRRRQCMGRRPCVRALCPAAPLPAPRARGLAEGVRYVRLCVCVEEVCM
jgi:vesicle coat complex subunit